VLDLTPIYASYKVARGTQPYHPKLLLYGYAVGVFSSGGWNGRPRSWCLPSGVGGAVRGGDRIFGAAFDQWSLN